MAKFFWVLTVLGGLFSAFALTVTLASANGAPQEAAGAAVSCAIAIIPYVLARASEGLARRDPPKQPLTFDQLPAHMQQQIVAQQQAATQQQGTGT
jgi:hypothetical protein